jgi:hypothetical protein
MALAFVLRFDYAIRFLGPRRACSALGSPSCCLRCSSPQAPRWRVCVANRREMPIRYGMFVALTQHGWRFCSASGKVPGAGWLMPSPLRPNRPLPGSW